MVKRLSGSWVRVVEHWVFRIGSLMLSLFSAYAVHLFFVPLSGVDRNEVVLTWSVAVVFGVFGYVIPRGMVHRLMNQESVWAYAPVCFLVELIDMSCNYVLAASAVRSDVWIALVPAGQEGISTVLTYIILSVIPLISVTLVVVDMDLERKKQDGVSTTTKKPLIGKTEVQPLRLRANQASGGNSGSGAAKSGGATNDSSSTAAKRATYWNNQRDQSTQPSQRTSSNPMTYDPDKDLAGAGVP